MGKLRILRVLREVKGLKKSQEKSINQNGKSINSQGSGSEYHLEHAGNIEGYGEIDPNARDQMNKDDHTNQLS